MVIQLSSYALGKHEKIVKIVTKTTNAPPNLYSQHRKHVVVDQLP